jgi:hypothetical protein
MRTTVEVGKKTRAVLGKGSPGDDRPKTKKNYQNPNQETKLTLGYAQ